MSHAFISIKKSSLVRCDVSQKITFMQENMLCSLQRHVNSALYTFTISGEVQFSFLAAHQTMFGNEVLIVDSEVRFMMKQQ